MAIPIDGPVMSIFLPTPPNPNSGFLTFVPLRDMIELHISVKDNANLASSASLENPNAKNPTRDADSPAHVVK